MHRQRPDLQQADKLARDVTQLLPVPQVFLVHQDLYCQQYPADKRDVIGPR